MTGRWLTVLALIAVLAVGACTTAPSGTGGSSDPSSIARPGSGAIRVAAVGDSITAGDSPDFEGGALGPQSWVSHAVGDDIEFAGGWAVWGASTAAMAEGVQAPFDADVLVILGGTNDVSGVSHTEIGANIVRIAENAGVERVVLSSIPPIDFLPENPVALNAYLETLAAEQGWIWVDAAAGLRNGDRFAEGMAYDGVHPTAEGARVLGEAIAAAIVDATA